MAVCRGELLSDTCTVKVYWLLAEGVPEMLPVIAASVSPGGRAPELVAQLQV